MWTRLYAIYQGLILARSLDIEELICYSNSLLGINHIKGLTTRFHVHVVLIQEVNDSIEQSNVVVCHTLRGKSLCGLYNQVWSIIRYKFVLPCSPLEDLLHLLKFDANGTFYAIE